MTRSNTEKVGTRSMFGLIRVPLTGTCCAARIGMCSAGPPICILEGSDQHRGWFHSSLLTAVMLDGQPPYQALLTHGFTVDGEGRKMSKSLGNVMAPRKIADALGAEMIRLWV